MNKFLSPLYFQINDKTHTINIHVGMHSHGEQVFLCELQVIIITEPPQHSPRGLMTTSLDEEGVQEEKA